MFYLQRGSYVEAIRLNEVLKQDTMVSYGVSILYPEAAERPACRISNEDENVTKKCSELTNTLNESSFSYLWRLFWNRIETLPVLEDKRWRRHENIRALKFD